MLKELKEVYLQAVTALPNHKELNQIELAEGYKEGGRLRDAYLAALVLRYWNIIEKLVYKDYGLYDPKEAYDWFIEALMYILDACPWRDEKSSVYNDPKAIERTLNTCVKCSRANWFQASNRQKRKINHLLASLDALSDEFNDAYVPRELVIEGSADTNTYRYIVLDAYNKQQYLFALMIDVIVNDVNLDKCTDTRSLILNVKKSIKSLPSNYPALFAKTYGLKTSQVENSFRHIYNMSDNKLRQSIENYIYKLKVLLKSEE